MHTFSQVLDADVVELFDLLHDQLLLVDLDDHSCVTSIAPCETEFAERRLQLLWNIDSMGLRMFQFKCNCCSRTLTMMVVEVVVSGAHGHGSSHSSSRAEI